MAYSEKDGQVVLTMTKSDYDFLLRAIGAFTFFVFDRKKVAQIMNRLNSGNPNYTPYQTEPTK